MTDPRKQAFAPYVRRLADLTALKDWHIEIGDGVPDNPTAACSVWMACTQKRAIIQLSEYFLDQPADRQRHYLLHELIHLHVETMWETVRVFLPPGESAQEVMRIQVEYMVDALADAFDEFVPAPDQPGPEQ